MKFLKSLVVLCVMAGNMTYSQTGPGGVGDNTSNILWLKGNALAGYAEGENITTWLDASGNDDHAVQADTSKSPDYVSTLPEFNNQPAAYFDGNNDVLDFSAVTHAAGNYDVFMVYKADVTASCHTVDIQSGRIIFGHQRGAVRAYNEGGTWRGTQISGIDPLITNFKLDDAGADVIINGIIQDTNQLYTHK